MNVASSAPLSPTYSFAELDGSQRDTFIHVWEASFDRKLPPAVYDWIFDGTNRLYAAFAGAALVAGYCLYPVEAVFRGEVRRVALCNNVFAAPEHQGRFLFSRLGRYALRSAAEKGIALAYGVPNPGALPGHRRVGWSWQSVPFFSRLRVTAAQQKRSLSPWQQRKPTRAELNEIEACSRRSGAGREFSVIKTAAFSHWRYVRRPLVDYWFATVPEDSGIAAYAFAKYFAEKRYLHIVDMDGTVDGVEALIASIDEIDEPFEVVNLWSTTVHSEAFVQAGFALAPDSSTLILIEPATLQGLTIKHGLHLVLGDNDVY